MSAEPRTVVRDFRPEDRDAAIGVLLAAIYLTPTFDESSVMVLLLPGGIAEIVFALWLTIRGANAPAQVADSDPHVGTAPRSE